FFFSRRRRHTRCYRDWSSDVCSSDLEIRITRNGRQLYSNKRDHVQRTWSETTWRMQALRDHPECAREEFDRIIDPKDPGLSVALDRKSVVWERVELEVSGEAFKIKKE